VVTSDIEWHRRQISLIDDLMADARGGWPLALPMHDVSILQETRERLVRSLQGHLDLRQANVPEQVAGNSVQCPRSAPPQNSARDAKPDKACQPSPSRNG
jgi:hypothetical protein